MLIQNEIGLLDVLQDTSVVSRIVLLILLAFSIWSWGIILSKMLLLKKIAAESEQFWKIFRKAQSLSEVTTASETLSVTPLVPVFNSASEILQPRTGISPHGSVSVKAKPKVNVVARAMQRAAAAELTALENRLTFLATTASVAPFIGLLGTVLGVLMAFANLRNSESASLKAVGPGMADALIATAFGLFAAIPAVIAYNHFVYRLRNVGGQLDELQSELLTIAEGDE
jgi:biopolymer transport protein TolQ